MITDLTKEYKEKGFYYISPIYYRNREFIKCGNVNNNVVYFFEIISNNILEINDTEILEKLIQRYNYKTDKNILK